MSSVSVCDSSWGLTGDWLFSWRLTTSVPHPDEETEMHTGKLRDWDQQNTMLVSVRELAQPVGLSTLASVNALYRDWTEKWEHCRNTYKCGNVTCSIDWSEMRWKIKDETLFFFCSAFFIPRMQNVMDLDSKISTESYYLRHLAIALTQIWSHVGLTGCEWLMCSV